MVQIIPFPTQRPNPDELLRSCIRLAIVADLNEPTIARRLRALSDSFCGRCGDRHRLIAAAAAARARYGPDHPMVRHFRQKIVA